MEENVISELSELEIDMVSGGNPILIMIASAALGFQMGKSIADKNKMEPDTPKVSSELLTATPCAM